MDINGAICDGVHASGHATRNSLFSFLFDHYVLDGGISTVSTARCGNVFGPCMVVFIYTLFFGFCCCTHTHIIGFLPFML